MCGKHFEQHFGDLQLEKKRQSDISFGTESCQCFGTYRIIAMDFEQGTITDHLKARSHVS